MSTFQEASAAAWHRKDCKVTENKSEVDAKVDKILAQRKRPDWLIYLAGWINHVGEDKVSAFAVKLLLVCQQAP